MVQSPPQDIDMMGNQTPPSIPTEEQKYGGFTRFEIELEVSPHHETPHPISLSTLAMPCYCYMPAALMYMTRLIVSIPVRPISSLTSLSQPPRSTKVLR